MDRTTLKQTTDLPVSTITELLSLSCKRYTYLPAFTHAGATLEYQELDRLSTHFASYIQHHTLLEKGDRIALLLPNLLQFPVALFGALKAGLVVINLNPQFTANELQRQMQDSEAKAAVVLSQMSENLAEIINTTSLQTVIVTNVVDLHSPMTRWWYTFSSNWQLSDSGLDSFAGTVGFRKALKLGEKKLFKKVSICPDDLAFLQYTGGTTGVAKGVMLHHRQLIANMHQINDVLSEILVSGKEVVCTPLPIYHIYSLTFHCLVMLSHGSHMVLIPNPRDLDALVGEFVKYPFTILAGLNTHFIGLCQHSIFVQLDFNSLKATFSGGVALTQSAAHEWESVTGSRVLEGYGLTEASPVVSANSPRSVASGTVGKPLRDTQVKILGEEGDVLSYGETGELWVKGPQVMQGYWNKPVDTKQVLVDGWLKTGDIARVDPQGNIQIVDRQKDMINVSGFAVYPNELEKVISCHPDVLECAAIGIPDEICGEHIKLYVVSSNQRLSIRDVRDYCRERLTSYKVPRVVEFRKSLPHNGVGKVLRRQLREEELNALQHPKYGRHL
ncbi:long-chain acyl-CoA synthetase [Neptunomonas japonica JAMM 1380]|uniref:Long-chain-fatty-acid--CoA ligase n=1 Tax=Neptunomonas japonica JAMM 1380 TaxID=1441457 RepID=A0A7R6PTB8_9GAMM|nr:long-chain acyl-CoA synthetase [Neptunomonas japonica JAMM 1380]